jgi:hypothetical protein
MVTAGVPSLRPAADGWGAATGHELLSEHEVGNDLAGLWGGVGANPARAAVFTAAGSERGFVRLVETGAGRSRQLPVEETGPFAIEFFSRDVQEAGDRIAAAAGFELRSPPTAYDLQSIGSGLCRSLAAQGPGDLWIFVTTMDWVPPPRELPTVPQLVGAAVNAPIVAVDRPAAVAFWRDLLGVPIRFDGTVSDPEVNGIMLAPPDWAFHITVFSFGDGQMIEHHFHPRERVEVASETPGVRSGAAGYTLRASGLDDLVAGAGAAGFTVRGPAVVKHPPYDGARVATIVDPHGALVELVES